MTIIHIELLRFLGAQWVQVFLEATNFTTIPNSGPIKILTVVWRL